MFLIIMLKPVFQNVHYLSKYRRTKSVDFHVSEVNVFIWWRRF